MNNYWFSMDRWIVTWIVELEHMRSDPESLLDLACRVIDLGDRNEVLVPRSGSDYCSSLRAEWNESSSIDLFKSESRRAFDARVAWFSARDVGRARRLETA